MPSGPNVLELEVVIIPSLHIPHPKQPSLLVQLSLADSDDKVAILHVTHCPALDLGNDEVQFHAHCRTSSLPTSPTACSVGRQPWPKPSQRWRVSIRYFGCFFCLL
jgi:hypothetical protein